jgi:hypothetical protein
MLSDRETGKKTNGTVVFMQKIICLPFAGSQLEREEN